MATGPQPPVAGGSGSEPSCYTWPPMADAALPGAAPHRRPRRRQDVETGRLRVHDPSELIRWLALSQPDPRKALAELVQNSLDAGARTIRVVRRREKGRGRPVLLDG